MESIFNGENSENLYYNKAADKNTEHVWFVRSQLMNQAWKLNKPASK